MGRCGFIQVAFEISSSSQRWQINTVWRTPELVRINSWCTCQGGRSDFFKCDRGIFYSEIAEGQGVVILNIVEHNKPKYSKHD